MSAREDALAAKLSALIARVAPDCLSPPVLQPESLYLELLGEDLRARAFTVTLEDGGEAALRPDMTAPIVRAALAREGWSAPGFWVRYDGLVFRRQPPGARREREVRQVGAERFAPPGENTPSLEAETFALALEGCRSAGVEPTTRLGDAGLFAAFAQAAFAAPSWAERFARSFDNPRGLAAAFAAAERADLEAGPDALSATLAAMPEALAVEMVESLAAAQGAAFLGGRAAVDVARRLRAKAQARDMSPPSAHELSWFRAALAIDDRPAAALAALAALADTAPGAGGAALRARLAHANARHSAIAALAKLPEHTRFCAGFGRGRGYYDGFLFEFEAANLGERASVGGGGRYDALLAEVARRERPGLAIEGWSAMGFSLRPQRLLEAAG